MLTRLLMAILGAGFLFLAVVTITKIINCIQERLNNGASKVIGLVADPIITGAIKEAIDHAEEHSIDELNALMKINEGITPETTAIANMDKDGKIYDLSLITTNHLDEEAKELFDKNNGVLVVTA